MYLLSGEEAVEARSITYAVPTICYEQNLMWMLQDLGNTNFSIHLPRTEFDRFSTGKLVLKAVQSLGIDANLNDRNDICVGKDKMSTPVPPWSVLGLYLPPCLRFRVCL
jgi:hypothetical protein